MADVQSAYTTKQQCSLLTKRRLFFLLIATAITMTIIYSSSKYIRSLPSARSASCDHLRKRASSLSTLGNVTSAEHRDVHSSSTTKNSSDRVTKRVTINPVDNGYMSPNRPEYSSYELCLNEFNRTKLKTIRFLDGWRNSPDVVESDLARSFPSTSLQTCGYRCEIQAGTSPAGADISIFLGAGMKSYGKSPPKKGPEELWVFHSGESQYVNALDPQTWDGMFNYSTVFLRETGEHGSIWGQAYRKLSVPTKRNFAEERRLKCGKPATADALWFVSNCHDADFGDYQPKSARVHFALALSQYINISAYTHSQWCTGPLASIMKKDGKGGQPAYDHFLFYLSFENNVCRDYITEKLWKILLTDTYTIPIVLGGKDIADYTRIAPPNSFIHVRNFTSPKHLADHLNYIASNDDAFNYYHQWRNGYRFERVNKLKRKLCFYCMLAHERPQGIWKTFSKDFSTDDCTDLTQPEKYCKYYNMSCSSTVNPNL